MFSVIQAWRRMSSLVSTVSHPTRMANWSERCAEMNAFHDNHSDVFYSLVSSDRRKLFRRHCSELFSSTDNKRSGTTVFPLAYCHPLMLALLSSILLWFTDTQSLFSCRLLSFLQCQLSPLCLILGICFWWHLHRLALHHSPCYPFSDLFSFL